MPNSDRIKIAVVDDDEDDFFIISDYIHAIEGREFEIDWFQDYQSAIEMIRERAYDLYFVDYFLGSRTGLDLLREAASIRFDRPIVLLTGFGSKEIDISAMQSGATDYLAKSELNTEKLERCIRYALERSQFLFELKSSEMKYRNLFESSRDAVFIADTNLAFVEVNHSAQTLLQPKSGNLIGQTLFDFVDDEVQRARIHGLVRASGNIDDLEIKLRSHNNNDEDSRTCLLSLYVHPDEEIPIVHGIIHDITNIKKAEYANLQSEKLAANERLIRMLAHEIRNPLNNIVLSVEHLLPDAGEEQKDFLGIIQRNSIRINQIITELLNLASPAELAFEKHTLQDIMDESLARASDRISLHKINVDKKYPSDPMIVSADKNKLIIALTNILINAVEAMESEKGNLGVFLDANGETYSVSIKDNGRGIPREHLSKLFDPFFTLKKNGMGLGLTASYSIIQSHKAKMHVESNVDVGTNFLIRFNKGET